MIVISTNNGSKFLPNLLKSIDVYGAHGHEICIVDTGSTDAEFISYLNSLDRGKYQVTKTPYVGYDTGAYVWAYKNYVSDEYIFMHDSMEIISDTWVAAFRYDKCDVCYYAGFPMAFDEDAQKQRLIDIGIYNEKAPYGVFGPIFYAKRRILDAMDVKFDLRKVVPSNKLDQMGMERGWSMMAESVGARIAWLSMIRSDLQYENVFYRSMKKFRPTRG